MENSIKMDDLGVPLFLETPIFTYNHVVSLYKQVIGLPVRYLEIPKYQPFREKNHPKSLTTIQAKEIIHCQNPLYKGNSPGDSP